MNWVPLIPIVLLIALVGCLFVFLAKQDQRLRALRRQHEENDPLQRLREQIERTTRESERRFGPVQSDADAFVRDWANVSGDFGRVFESMARVGTRVGFTPEEIASAEHSLRAAGISVETLRDHTGMSVRMTRNPAAPGVSVKTVKNEPQPPSWQRRIMDDDE